MSSKENKNAKKLITIISKDCYTTYRVKWSDEDGKFIGTCGDFPSLSWVDDNPEEALRGIRMLVLDTIEDMKK